MRALPHGIASSYLLSFVSLRWLRSPLSKEAAKDVSFSFILCCLLPLFSEMLHAPVRFSVDFDIIHL